MIIRTEEEIKNKIIDLLGFDKIKTHSGETELQYKESMCNFEIKISGNSKEWTIQILQMYNYVDVNFKFLNELSKFFGTDNINDSRYSTSGCETCDFGSSYEVTLYIEE